MTTIYSAIVQSIFAANTDTLAIEIDATTNATVKIRKIRISHDDGTATTSSDYQRKVKLVRESSAGSGGSSYTPIPVDSNTTASVSTVNINSGSFTPGGISSTLDIQSQHSSCDFVWEALDEEDKIIVAPGGIFGVTVNPAH